MEGEQAVYNHEQLSKAVATGQKIAQLW
jgi:hypothetical protein